jgi:hypothetical protein
VDAEEEEVWFVREIMGSEMDEVVDDPLCVIEGVESVDAFGGVISGCSASDD